jgi:serine/threonine-protein kinase ULK2
MDTLSLKNYRIEQTRIGTGSFSVVYKGYNSNNKTVAIKKIYLEKTNNIDLFFKEFKILRSLNHKNIIKVHDIILEENITVYLILDYYHKGDLTKYLNKRCLKEKFAQHYAIQIKDGLKYLLSKKIIHRDLKPQNILVSDDNLLKICDFGFARHFKTDMMFGTICGSPLYMAPEIMSKNKYGNKVDLWSLGVIIFEMLYGTVPFKGKNIIELIKNIETKTVVFPQNFNVSEECKLLLQNLLKKDPKDRLEWPDLFENKWFNNNFMEVEENKLLEISFSKGMPMPNLENYNFNESKFLDIKLTENSTIQNTPSFDSYKYTSVCDGVFELNFENSTSITSELSELSEEFKSFESDNELYDEIKSHELDNSKIISKPISISQKPFTESYIFVSPNISRETNISLSSGIKNLLSSSLSNSLTFIKHGIDYISKSNSL